MTAQQLTDILAQHGVKIDGYHGGAGKFRDVYAGTGEPSGLLHEVADDLKCRGIAAEVTRVTASGHPDFGQPMLEIDSFWWEEA